MRDFEEVKRTVVYNPSPDNELPDMSSAFEPSVLGKPVVDEINAWANLIHALKDGFPKPYDPTIIVKKIQRLEQSSGDDLSALKANVMVDTEIQEAKEVKPLIYGILDRIQEIANLESYVKRYENG